MSSKRAISPAVFIISVWGFVWTAAPLPAWSAEAQAKAPVYGYRIVNRYPHDRNAFTQGLVYKGDDRLYESTGLQGQSTLREVQLVTGKLERLARLPPKLFGEGVTRWQDRLIQLTWKSGLALVFDETTFRASGRFEWPREGWGITHDGSHLIVSDGSDVLYFVDPKSFETVRQVRVTDAGEPVPRLNELEYVEGEIYANVWTSDRIARISPADGQVVGWIDLSGLLVGVQRTGQEDVLNGIAYDADGKRLFVTGKRWPVLFQIEVTAPPAKP